ncbi:MAG: ATP-binding protein [Clostridiales Family XIII bacterium]|jgi:AAA+ ATPase superfamily predicted ATPase|nr:ATP-binding protein [Clostridiales Family XIII bacterium]
MKIIGRDKEKKLLKQCMQSGEPEFITVYGRRRVGKTYLINEFFDEDFAFSVTGLAGEDKAAQLKNFCASIKKYSGNELDVDNWYDAFEALITMLEKSRVSGRKIIFIDELPWLDTRKSGFLSALEHFWNGWANSNRDILLIVCGSATSWMINKLIRNRGGLHNRVTRRMRINPFTLVETEEYLIYKNINVPRIDIAQAYMVFGGIPFYLKQLEQGKSIAQNIDRLCFEKDSFMLDEFSVLFKSLFRNSEKHLKVLTALGSKKNGLLREDILDLTGLKSGGGVTAVLDELEQCGFIEATNDYSGKSGRYVYQLTDFFTAFYLKFMKKNKQLDTGYWSKTIGSGTYYAWAGPTFEKLCRVHIDKIKNKLSIGGILATPYAWAKAGKEGVKGAQIDLLIDRNDNIINICECKFVNDEFVIDKDYDEALRNKIGVFVREVKTRKTPHITMITTYGVKQNKYSGIVQSEVILEDLF